MPQALTDPLFLALLPLMAVLVLASQLSLFWALQWAAKDKEGE